MVDRRSVPMLTGWLDRDRVGENRKLIPQYLTCDAFVMVKALHTKGL